MRTPDNNVATLNNADERKELRLKINRVAGRIARLKYGGDYATAWAKDLWPLLRIRRLADIDRKRTEEIRDLYDLALMRYHEILNEG